MPSSNVCAVRILQESFHQGRAANFEAMMHESESQDRFAVNHVRDMHGLREDRQPLVGDYAECKHCGCLYFEASNGGVN